jgi:hypothetical protein
MRLRTASAVSVLGLSVCACALLWGQKPFKEYPAIEYNDFPFPRGWNPNDKTEWVRARLRYPDIYGYPNSRYRMRDGSPFPGYWTMDYPRSDRHLLEGVRRLTRIDTRLVEQVVDLDGSDDVYNWPVLYGVEVGHWLLPDDQAARLRDFIQRGGFFMCDDFHGDEEWSVFINSMSKVFPNRPIEDIDSRDPIFHTIFDLDERFQVPGAQYLETGLTYEKGPSGKVPHWRCIRDDKGRIVVAICHNMDLGDAWEHADNPRYPEKWTSLAYRIATNYFIYDLTH